MKIPISNKIALAVSLLIAISTGIAQNLEGEDPLLSKFEVTSDIIFLLKAYNDIHPAPYTHIDSLSMTRFKDQLIASLPDEVSMIQARRALGSISSKFSLGHSDIIAHAPLNENEKRNHFPLEIECRDNRLFVKKNISNQQSIKTSNEILGINGVSTNEILEVFMNSMSFELKATKEYYLSYFFSDYLRFYFNFRSPVFQIDIKHKNEATMSYSLRREEIDYKSPKIDSSYFHLSFLNDYTAMITIDIFVKKRRFRKFLKDAFQQIRAKNISSLIIDLRGNPGGNSGLIPVLANYLTSEPYAALGEALEKTSKESKKYNHKKYWYVYPFYPLLYFIPDARPKFTKKSGSITKIDIKERRPKKLNNKFKGDVYVLVNEGTYSTASVLASSFQCHGIAKIVGRSTGEPVLGDGNAITVVLPSTGIKHYIGTILYRNVCYENASEDKMLIPDILTSEKDELNYLLTRIKRKLIPD